MRAGLGECVVSLLVYWNSTETCPCYARLAGYFNINDDKGEEDWQKPWLSSVIAKVVNIQD